MIAKIALFEIRKRFRQISTYIYFGIFFVITFLAVLSAGGAFQQDGISVVGSGGKVMINSPIVLFMLVSTIHHFGVIITAAVMGQAIYQDYHHRTFTMFFTSPIHKLQYLAGRFLGNQIVLLCVFSSIGFGAFFASVMPFVDKELFGPNRLWAYLAPYAFCIIPNLLLTGTIFFGLAALTRKILPVYTGSVILLIGYLIANSITNNLDQRDTAALLDPFGTQAVGMVAQYWSPAEQNARNVPLIGVFLWNRVLWLSVSVGLWVITAWRFKASFGGERKGARVEAAPMAVGQKWVIPKTEQRDYRALYRLPGLTWLNFKETVKNIYFSVIVLAGVLFLIMASQVMSSLYGTETYPITALIVELTGGSFALFVLIIITFYSGELVWRERDSNIHQLMDVLPIPDWLPLAAKTLALILVQVLLAAVIMLVGIGIQVCQGYFNLELGVYFKQLFVLDVIEYSLICVLAITVQTLIIDKYLGHLVMILYYLMVTFVGQLGLEHNLFKYGRNPGATYSDMNGFGHFIPGIAWFDGYWALWAILMALVANLFWVRGTDNAWSSRRKLAMQRYQSRHGLIGAGTMVAIVLTAGWIYYSTCVLNPYRTSKQTTMWAVNYEKKYRTLIDAPQPRFTAVKVDFDLYPERRALHSKGEMSLRNKTSEPISKVYVGVPWQLSYDTLTLGDQNATSFDKEFGLYTFELKEPMAPGAESVLKFEFKVEPKGFTNTGDRSSAVVYNGTFLNSGLFPSLGYNEQQELSSDSDRRRYQLPVRERMASIDNLKARGNTYISQDSDWVSLESTVSTTMDQIAIVPGYLQKEWTENNRRYYTYKTDGRILNFYSVLSARYEVKRDTWHGKVSFGKKGETSQEAVKETLEDRESLFVGSEQDVSIEIYYQKGHEYNIDAMVQAIKDSLDYYTTNFGPYQHRQVRILEFPRYESFAQSFPNTIPFSEAIGFVARVDPNDPDDIDFPYYVTAHEIAHQWWAHQVIGGNVQGATFMSETLSQYSALMVMKKKVGDGQMRKFLRYELDRYLTGRGLEKKKELPLALNENQQYIHYNKGSLVMYGLQDFIGEERVNRALARYVRKVAYQEPPYTTSNELVDLLREETPEEMRYLIEDLFETITLFDNRTTEAKYVEKDGKFEVTVKVLCMKVRADEKGTDQEIPADDWIDIGVLDEKNQPIAMERKKVVSGSQEFKIIVEKQPVKAGIDPLNKLIDRNPGDNTLPVSKG